MRYYPILVLLLVLVLAHFPKALAGTLNPTGFPSRPGELIVKLKSDPQSKSEITFSEIAGTLSSTLQKNSGKRSNVAVRTLLTTSQYAVFKVSESDRNSAMELLKSDARVAYSEPNYIYHAFGPSDLVPNDPSFSSLWGMKNTGQADPAPNPSATPGQLGKAGSDIHVTPVWGEGITGSKSIKVAVIDTGIDYTHPDLKANVDQADGFNFVTNTAGGLDDHGHGSHCSGTIGASGNNGQGVAGVNWNVTLIPVKFLDATGSGAADGALQAIQYATKLGVNIMSNSWGGGPFSQALLDAITDAKNKGILFVAAAGNAAADNDTTPSYPASYAVDNIISVAASDSQDKLAVFSNYGRTTVHVAAPGVNILSTVIGGNYGVMSGTSMATPHISGIAALMMSSNPSLTYAQVKEAIVTSCDPVRGLSRKVTCGGRANVYNAIHGIHPPSPAPPENLWKDVPMAIQSLHPYESSKTYNFPILVPGAKYIRVIFDTLDTEAGYDFVHLTQANGDEIETLSGTHPGYISDYLEGSRANLILTTDSSINKTGFSITHVQAIY